MTQPEVAWRVPCVRSYISKYERGFVVPGLETLSKLAPALGVTLRDLVNESIAVEQLVLRDGDAITQMVAYVGRLDSTSRYVIVQTARRLVRGLPPFRWLR